jgi:hypothetical protein
MNPIIRVSSNSVRKSAFVVGVIGLFAGVQPSQAKTTTWTNFDLNAIHNWTDSANWQGNQYPDNGVPTAGDTWAVTIRTGKIALNSNITINSLDMTGGLLLGVTIGPNVFFKDGVLYDKTTGKPTTLAACCANNFNLTIDQNFTWGGGDINSLPMSTGKIISNDTATITTGLNVLGTEYTRNPRLNGFTLVNNGTMSLVDTAPPMGKPAQKGSLDVGYGSEIVNNGTFKITGNQVFGLGEANGTAPLPIIMNKGTFEKTGGNGTSSIPFNVENIGKFLVQTGTIQIGSKGTYFQTKVGAITDVSAGATLASVKNMIVDRGMIGGDGTIESPNLNLGGGGLKDAAKLQGGDAPGTVTVVGNINLMSGSALLTLLGGTTQGAADGYSFVDESGGVVNLSGGDLEPEFVDGFQSQVTRSDVFDILQYTNSIQGAFMNAPVSGDRVFSDGGLGSFQVYYLGDVVQLSNFQAVPEPRTAALLGIGLAALLVLRRRGEGAIIACRASWLRRFMRSQSQHID